MWQTVNEPTTVSNNAADDLKDRIKRMQSLQVLSKDETIRLRQKHVGESCTLWFKKDPLKIVQGVGQYMYDENGRDYLDCINNVAHVGHANKHIAAAISKQLQLINTNSRFLHDNLSLYAQRLCKYFPSHLSTCYMVNSGSEANDLAIRLARAFTGKKDIVCVDGAYHGNLTSTMAISPYKTDHLLNYEQELWAHIAPLPCAYRGIYSSVASAKFANKDPEAVGKLYAEAAIKVMEQAKANGRRIAAFIVESMVSCGGQFPLPTGYLRRLQKYLRQENILLICDEVQTGFGRCGKKMWAFQLDGDDIQPDIVTMGKPMGNGYPVSAVVTRPSIGSAFSNIGTEYFNTFGGNPASCAAALAVLDEIEDKKLIEHADKVGSYILREMHSMKSISKYVGNVRGYGFFLGMEIVENRESRSPAPKIADLIVLRFREERILMSTEGKFGNVLKFKPPMVFSLEDAKRFVMVLRSALGELELIPDLVEQLCSSQQATNVHKRIVKETRWSTSSSCSTSSCLESSYSEDD